MDFRTTEEQRGFARALHDLMASTDPVTVARAWAAGDHGPGLALWRRLAEQGVNALVVPEEHGGLGGGPVDLVVAFEVLGHQLAAGPWVESLYLAKALPPDELGAVAEGVVATVAVPPHVPYAVDADVATLVHLVTPDGVHRATPGERVRSVDTTRHLFAVTPGTGPAVAGGREDAFDHAVLASSAQLLGCAERLLSDTVAYVQERRQYGRTIGSYQAVKHQLADVRIGLDFARPLVHGAAVAMQAGVPTATRSVSAAKVGVGDAAHRAARVALQLHGAVGYTAELDLGLWINRVHALRHTWGTSTHHRGRIAAALPGAG